MVVSANNNNLINFSIKAGYNCLLDITSSGLSSTKSEKKDFKS